MSNQQSDTKKEKKDPFGTGMSTTTNKSVINAATGELCGFRAGSRESLQMYIMRPVRADREVISYYYDSPAQYEAYTKQKISKEAKTQWLKYQIDLGFRDETGRILI